ncbi:Right handed beta helix region [uncultured archaeon]|nr:Right handed beta helix region [uncultured archaeon]
MVKKVILAVFSVLLVLLLSSFVSAVCGPLSNSYTMTGNETTAGDCFTILANSITLDCAGFGIFGAFTGTAIKMNGRSNIIIKNCNIAQFETGINISNSNNVEIDDTMISDVTTGIFIDPTSGPKIRNVDIGGACSTGLKLDNSADGDFQTTTVAGCDVGLDIGPASFSNHFTECDFSENIISDIQNAGPGSIFTDVRCISGTGVECREDVPFFADFSNGFTTDFSNPLAVPDLSHVASAEISNGVAGILWDYSSLDVRDADLNNNVKIGDNYVSVNSPGLPASFNAMARVSLAVPSCSNYVIYKSSEFSDSAESIIESGSVCTPLDCSGRTCSNGVLSFTVDGFSGYASGPGTNLTIWDDTDSLTRYENEQVKFFANYSNATNGNPILLASCNVTFQVAPVGPFAMAYNATSKFYEYNRTFSAAGVSNWDVNCSAPGYANLLAADTVTISPLAGDPPVPEFSTYTLLLALLIVICGVLIRRNQ